MGVANSERAESVRPFVLESSSLSSHRFLFPFPSRKPHKILLTEIRTTEGGKREEKALLFSGWRRSKLHYYI